MTKHSLHLAVAAAMILASGIFAADAGPMELLSRRIAIPENGYASEIVVRTSQFEVALVPPPQWRLSVDTNATTLTWQTPDFHTMLRLRLVAGQGGGTAQGSEVLRARVQAEFPEAEIRDVAECFSATHSGTSFELEERKTRFPTVTRLAFLPLDGGRLELQLTGPLDESESARHRLTSIMNSLRVVTR